MLVVVVGSNEKYLLVGFVLQQQVEGTLIGPRCETLQMRCA